MQILKSSRLSRLLLMLFFTSPLTYEGIFVLIFTEQKNDIYKWICQDYVH